MTPDEIALVISLVQWALTTGKDAYDAYQLKALADLEAKLQGQIATAQQDRETANADIDARDKALEADLAAKK